MNKRFVIVVDSIDVNDSSGSKANVAIITNLAAIAKSVLVLHYTQQNIFLNNVECVAIKEKKNNLFYLLSRTQRIIQRYLKINLARYLEPIFGFSFTFFNDVNSIKQTLIKQNFTEVDLILTLSKGGSFRPHYAVNKLPYLHKKWIAYIHDPYPFTCYPPPYNWTDPGHKQKQAFFKSISINSEFSAFPSLLLKDWMSGFYTNFRKTAFIIPHQKYEKELIEIETPSYFDDAKFNLLHAGNLMKQRNPEGLIKGFELFLKNNPSAKNKSRLLLLGNASYHKKILKKYNNIMPELFVKLKNVPFNEAYWLQNKVSVNIILEANSEVSPFLPGKFPHCVSANKPILHLGPIKSETYRLLGDDYQFHSLVYDVNEIANCMEHLYNLWMTNGNGLKLNRKDLDYYVSVSYLNEVLLKVLGNQ